MVVAVPARVSGYRPRRSLSLLSNGSAHIFYFFLMFIGGKWGRRHGDGARWEKRTSRQPLTRRPASPVGTLVFWLYPFFWVFFLEDDGKGGASRLGAFLVPFPFLFFFVLVLARFCFFLLDFASGSPKGKQKRERPRRIIQSGWRKKKRDNTRQEKGAKNRRRKKGQSPRAAMRSRRAMA